MTKIKIYILLILVVICGTTKSQIYSSNASFTDSTNYESVNLNKSPIFVYSIDKGDYNPQIYLESHLADSTGLNFTWQKFNYTTLNFDAIVQTDNNTDKSKYLCEGEGGYKVHITGSNTDTTFYAWVYICSFQIISINIKTSTCEFMQFQTLLNFDNDFLYYDPLTKKQLTKKHTYKVKEWECSEEEMSIPKILNPMIEAPTKYMSFYLTMTDNFEQERKSYISLEEAEQDDNKTYVVATKAKFEAFRDEKEKEETDSTGQAPLLVNFKNLSENATEYYWTFYNETSRIAQEGIDSVKATSILETPINGILYTLPGINTVGLYDVKLQTKGPTFFINDEEKQCVNTLLKPKYIQVDSVTIPEFANVFSPPFKPNNIFYFENGKASGFKGAKSVKEFSIKIYSRWGDKVYQYKGDINEWEGWDGTTLGNIVAETGVYFYSAFIKGWDDKDYNKRGSIHLFRDNE